MKPQSKRGEREMLKLERRDVTQFLDAQHQKALKKRAAAAAKLAALPASSDRGKKVRKAWDNFRSGGSSKGTCDKLWEELCTMSFTKCALCEVPGPGTIEHLDEKSKMPDEMYWVERDGPKDCRDRCLLRFVSCST